MDHQRKLAWARKHLDALDATMEAFLQSDACYATVEHDMKSGYCRARIRFAQELPTDWSLAVGDIVHNLRSALDALIYSLAVKHLGRAPTGREVIQIQFPVVDERKDWPGECGRRLAHVHADVRAAVERLQPYHRKNRRFKHPLAVLRDLSNVDKHRHLHLTRAVASKSRLNISGNGVFPGVVIEGYTGPLEDGTQIARWRMLPGASFDVEVKAEAELAVSFGNGPALGGGVLAFLIATHDHIRDQVLPELEGFL